MSPALAFFAFLLIMLALAALAIILDWMGNPIRRPFRPRTSGTPSWLIADSPETASQVAVPQAPVPRTAVAQAPAPQAPAPPVQAPQAKAPRPRKGQPWQSGDSIYQLTPKGKPPSLAAVRRRYWKNLSERPSSAVFGDANRALMDVGQAPQRFNPRIGATEELSLPEPMLRQCWAAQRKPTPTWGDKGLDPFSQP